MPYLGKSPLHGNYQKLDDFSGDFDGSDATHALAQNSLALTPVTEAAVIISINGVIQEPITDYTVSGTNITFTTAPAAGANFFGIVLGEQLDVGTPSDATVTTAKLATTFITGATDIGAAIVDADLFLMDDGAGGTLRKTVASRLKTYIGGSDPASADGDTLGTASLEWSDLYLADGSVIYFGNDQEIKVTHVADTGLTLKHTATADDKPITLTLQTGETDMAANDVMGKISFQAPDEGTGTDAVLVAAAIQARAEGDFSSSSNATSLDFMTGASEIAATKWSITSAGTFLNAGTNVIDMNAGKIDLDADADTSITADTDDQIDFEIGGTDRYTFGADKATFTFSIPGAFSANAGGPLALEPGTHTGVGDKMGLSFGQMTSGGSAIDDGTLIYDIKTGAYTSGGGSTHNSDLVFEVLNANAIAEKFRISGTGAAYIADSANAKMTVGLTINQGAADYEIFALKSSDIAHGISNQIETDSYCAIQKTSATAGGVRIVGATETKEGIRIQPMVTTADTTKSTSGESTCVVFGTIADGAGDIDVMAGDANVFGVLGTGAQTKFIVDSDGDIHADGSLSAYDEYDDAMLARAMQIQLSEQPKNEKVYGRIIQTEFDNFVKYNKQTLIDAGLLGKPTEESEKEGHRGLVNVTGMQRLHNGAIVQQRAMFETLKSVVEEMLPGFASKLNERLEAQSLPALPV